MDGDGSVVARCKSDRRTKKSRYFSSLFVVYLFTRLRGDRSVRENFSPFLLPRLSASSSTAFFLPEKDAPPTSNSTVRLVTLARFLRVSSLQTFWTTAVRSFPLIFQSEFHRRRWWLLLLLLLQRRIEIVRRKGKGGQRVKERKRKGGERKKQRAVT